MGCGVTLHFEIYIALVGGAFHLLPKVVGGRVTFTAFLTIKAALAAPNAIVLCSIFG